MEQNELKPTKAKTAQQKPNLLFAVLAAIGLGLVSCVLYGVLYYVGYVAWIASYVTVLAAAWGFKHFNKKMGWKGYLTVAIVSICGLLLSMFIALACVIAKEFGSSFGVAVKDLFMFLDTNTKLREGVLTDGILTAVFTLLGLLSYFFYEKRAEKALQKSQETNVDFASKQEEQIENENTVSEKAETLSAEVTAQASPEQKKLTAVPAELKEKPAKPATRSTAKKTTAKPQTKPLVVKPVVSNKPKATKNDKKGE